jgi:S-DNA-T family DNA segregation ATPase FtsK/SpoIIIE
MKLRVTYHRPAAAAVDVVVTADADVAVGDVASTIARVDPLAIASRWRMPTLMVKEGHGGRVVDPSTALGVSGVRSGASVTIVEAPVNQAETVDSPAIAAVLVVESGPDAGKHFPLWVGANDIGRDAANDVVLSDRLVSKKHARVEIGEHVEIVDRGAVNGVIVGDEQITRAIVQPDDRVLLGDTYIRIIPRALVNRPTSSTIAFNRSPRLDPV